MTLREEVEGAYGWLADLSLSVRIWIITLVGGSLAAAVTGGVPIVLFVAGAFTGGIARLMYE